MLNLISLRPTVHLAIARSDEVLRRLPAADSNWLSDSEQIRLQSLRVAQRRDHYLAGHWLIRELLAHAFASSMGSANRPEHWSLQDIKGRAPRVIDHYPVQLSISHSGDWVAAAVARQPLGIDIEQRPRLLDPAIQDLLLSPHETGGAIHDDELLQRWVAKEAWLKMGGESALPQRLKQLRLHATSNEFASVISYRSDHFHFAVAASPTITVQWSGDAGAIPTNGYRLEPLDQSGAMLRGLPPRKA